MVTTWQTALTTALTLTTFVTAGACQAGSVPAPPRPVSLRVLFIGNSLTYVNNLPGTLAGVARTGGDTIAVGMVALPNYALIDHLTNHSGAEEAIRRGGWDVVVLQQGPTTLPINRDSLVLWTRMFDSIIQPTGARTALFMVWPQGGSAAGFEAVRRSFQEAADAVHGVFLPAGVAWQIALERDSTLPLYGPDHFHPSPLGSYLAAITIYEQLTGHDARRLSPDAFLNGAALHDPPERVRLLQASAHLAVSGR